MAWRGASFTDSASSRRPKLKSIDPAHLVLAARAALFREHDARNCSPMHIVKLLTSAAQRGSDEATWLLKLLTSEGQVPVARRYDGVEVTPLDWLAEVASREDSPRARFYHGRAMLVFDENVGLELLRQSADGGFAPAMTELGVCFGNGSEYFRMGAAKDDPIALFLLAIVEGSRQWERCNRSAQGGHVDAMVWLVRNCRVMLGPAKCATLVGRCTLLKGWKWQNDPDVSEALKNLDAGTASGRDVQVAYNVGRELEGFEQFWDAGRTLDDQFQPCVNLYKSILQRARSAALQTAVVLREVGLARDVALLIARFVFESRDTEAAVWFEFSTK